MNRLNMAAISLILSLILGTASGCAPVISNNLMQQIDPSVTFEKAFDDPELVKGITILWGGDIVSTRNLKEGTLIEVVQKPLDRGKKPWRGDRSGGRFLALYDGFLDGEIYAKGRAVTVAGVIKGSRAQPLDEIEYTYPLISIKEIHLWPPLQDPPFGPPPHHPPGPWPYRYWW